MMTNNSSYQAISNHIKMQDYSNMMQSFSTSNNIISNNKNLSRTIEKHKNNYEQNFTDNITVNNNNNNFKVVIRIRPFLQRELESCKAIPILQVTNDHKMIQAIEFYNHDLPEGMHLRDMLDNTNKYTLHPFTFDHVFTEESTQLEVYEYTAKPAVHSTLMGYNATILAYGQTGTGKTHTMEGFKYNSQDPQRGIIPRCMEEIFKYIENISNAKTTFMVRASYLQIYNDVISDLLRTERTGLSIREDKKKGLYVEGLSEWAVRSPSEIYSLIQKGATSRATASTKMNDVSSRSHAVFLIIVEQMIGIEEGGSTEGSRQIRVGKLNLVDLAGSERVRVTGATGQRLEECKKINQSLSALGNVISALADQKQPKSHIPYRDSKITRLLEDSLGGNCITTMMTMVSPAIDAFTETLSSIKFANRAKNIKNAPVINEDVDQKALLRKYEAELKRLKSELEERNKILIDKKKLCELEEERKKAEMHKVAAVAALEARSKEFMQEREEKKKLEEKIRFMNSQVLIGGRKIEDTPQFRSALAEQQKIIRQEYEKRLFDLEKERTQIEEDKAQVDRYKQLLLKQRDIMIALTNRLNERDETIIQLQEELDAYDKIHNEAEENLEFQKAKTEKLEQILKEHNIAYPGDQEILAIVNKNLSNNGYNKDMVSHDGEETYNITKSNLIDAEERINELTKLSTIQKQEIQKLKIELESHKNINNNDNSYLKNNDMHLLQVQLKNAEEAANNHLKIIQQKDEEIKILQNANSLTKLNGENHSPKHKNKIEIKESIDHIIDCLSRQNEPEQLQEVAKKLLNLQKLINNMINSSKSPARNKSPENKTNHTNNSSSNIVAVDENNKFMNYTNRSKQGNISSARQFDEKQIMPKDQNGINSSRTNGISQSPTKVMQGNGILKPLISNINENINNNNTNYNDFDANQYYPSGNKESATKNFNRTHAQSHFSTLNGNNSNSLQNEIARLISSRGNNRNNIINENESSTMNNSMYNKSTNISTIQGYNNINNNNNNNNNNSCVISNKDKNKRFDIDNIINSSTHSKRSPLTVEEMLRQKREEANKK